MYLAKLNFFFIFYSFKLIYKIQGSEQLLPIYSFHDTSCYTLLGKPFTNILKVSGNSVGSINDKFFNNILTEISPGKGYPNLI